MICISQMKVFRQRHKAYHTGFLSVVYVWRGRKKRKMLQYVNAYFDIYMYIVYIIYICTCRRMFVYVYTIHIYTSTKILQKNKKKTTNGKHVKHIYLNRWCRGYWESNADEKKTDFWSSKNNLFKSTHFKDKSFR